MGKFEIEAKTGNEWKRVLAELRHQARDVGDQLEAATRENARETVQVVKAQALSLPAHTGKHSGARRRLASSVKIKRQRNGVQIVSDMHHDDAGLNKGFDNPRGWSHPTYGHKPTVHQFPGTTDGWFREPIRDDYDRYERAYENVLEDAAGDIAKAG